MLRDNEERLSLRGSASDKPPTKVSAKIREILTENLATDDLDLPQPGSIGMATPTLGSLTEENRLLQSELNRVEDLLSASRAERDEIGIKYNALSERVSDRISERSNQFMSLTPYTVEPQN